MRKPRGRYRMGPRISHRRPPNRPPSSWRRAAKSRTAASKLPVLDRAFHGELEILDGGNAQRRLRPWKAIRRRSFIEDVHALFKRFEVPDVGRLQSIFVVAREKISPIIKRGD